MRFNGRLENQNQWIENKLESGEITPGQAKKLHNEDRAIRKEGKEMSNVGGGHITPAEQKVLNQGENAISKKIGQ
jgi:hypothetical protein